MTKQQAITLAAFDDDYRARCIRGVWCVWCDTSDHVVEFDAHTVDRAEAQEALRVHAGIRVS